MTFDEAAEGLAAGDFSRLEPLFKPTADGRECPIIQWHREGRFAKQAACLAEALTCACFNGCIDVAEYLLANGVDPAGGARTGLNAVHWAANRGQLEAIKLLIKYKAPLEIRNSY